MSTVESVFDLEGDLEGGDGLEEGGSSLQAGLAASRRAEAKSAQVRDVVLNALEPWDNRRCWDVCIPHRPGILNRLASDSRTVVLGISQLQA